MPPFLILHVFLPVLPEIIYRLILLVNKIKQKSELPLLSQLPLTSKKTSSDDLSSGGCFDLFTMSGRLVDPESLAPVAPFTNNNNGQKQVSPYLRNHKANEEIIVLKVVVLLF